MSHAHYSHELMAARALRFVRREQGRPVLPLRGLQLPIFERDEDPDGFDVPSTEPFTAGPGSTPTKKYAAMVHRLDRDVGRLTDLVDDSASRKSPLILFDRTTGATGKSGPVRTAALRGLKSESPMGGIRVPLIARWPASSGGEDEQGGGRIWDFCQPFAEMAGGGGRPKGWMGCPFSLR